MRLRMPVKQDGIRYTNNKINPLASVQRQAQATKRHLLLIVCYSHRNKLCEQKRSICLLSVVKWIQINNRQYELTIFYKSGFYINLINTVCFLNAEFTAVYKDEAVRGDSLATELFRYNSVDTECFTRYCDYFGTLFVIREI